MNNFAIPFILYNLSLRRNKLGFIHKIIPDYSGDDTKLPKTIVKSKLNYRELSGVEKVYYNLILSDKIKTCKDLCNYLQPQEYSSFFASGKKKRRSGPRFTR
jgi:hypothetical protein